MLELRRSSREAPFISVVVPTHRRPELLRRSLQALTSEDYPPNRLEVIVVENGAPGTCRAVVDEARARSHVDIRYLVVPHGGPAAARNAGWRAAQGDIIAFTDDDTIPSPRWLAEGVASLLEGADVVSGRTVVPVSDRPTDAGRDARLLERATLTTCNAFCRRSFLERTGGLDPRFTRASRTGSDLELTLRAAGAELVHNPAAVVLDPRRHGSSIADAP